MFTLEDTNLSKSPERIVFGATVLAPFALFMLLLTSVFHIHSGVFWIQMCYKLCHSLSLALLHPIHHTKSNLIKVVDSLAGQIIEIPT